MKVEPVIRSKPWKKKNPPRKILVMRFQALGDTIITLPYLKNLKRQYPETQLHFLTREEVHAVPSSLALFDKVIVIGGARNMKLQLFIALLKLPGLWLEQYDAIIDLQNHRLSRILRKLVFKKAWSEFDRSSLISAGDRTKFTIEALWSWKISLDIHLTFKHFINTNQLLTRNGKLEDHDLVVINPAGYCSSRNWPLENYIAFARLWLAQKPKTQFVLLLLPVHREKATVIKTALGKYCIDLTGRANQLEAFSIVKQSILTLTEDSGLMHMSWVQGVPTLALFSSSSKVWSAPQGAWSACLDSSDMECGPCMAEVCKFHDNRCLTRYTPEIILNKVLELCEAK